jgi:hypothetical protein
MGRVDQRWVRGLGALVEGAGSADVAVQRDGDDGQPGGLELSVERLPPGQVEATASPRSPREQHHLPAPQGGDLEGVAVEVR